MALWIASLNSGSNGNCYYVGNEEEAVFIDAGLSCRETESRMRRVNLPMDRVKAIFISHEHSDHVTGMSGISKKYNIPVYITETTQAHCRVPLAPERTLRYTCGTGIRIGRLSVMPFRKYHDGRDPHSFTVSGNGVRIGVYTDLGRCCEPLKKHFAQCHAAFLEANYDEVMLDQGHYPYHLKNRIRGGNGHLSNREALDLFTTHRAPYLSHLLLAHLSKENNHPGLVEQLFRQHAGRTEVYVASRYQPSPVYRIEPGSSAPAPAFQHLPNSRPEQMSLF
jgi:phosphoribosyl 1,2-cyclic phosphodiesterase